MAQRLLRNQEFLQSPWTHFDPYSFKEFDFFFAISDNKPRFDIQNI